MGFSVQAVRGDPEHPANFGRLCSKGSTLHQTSRGGGRLLQPLARLSRDAPREAVEWEQAMALAARALPTSCANMVPMLWPSMARGNC